MQLTRAYLASMFAVSAFAQSVTVPENFRGTWAGTATQGATNTAVKVTLRLNATGGESDYEGLNCGGVLTPVAVSTITSTFKERITRGSCLSGADVTISQSGATAYFVWANESAPLSFFTGTLTRTGGAAGPSGEPSISTGGIVNAATFRASDGIAPGSIATIFGGGLGPATAVKAESYPLQTSLSGVSVRLSQGGTSVNAFPIFASAGQVNFIVSSQTPTGANQLTLTYNGRVSAPQTVQVVAASFGLFTFSRNGTRAVVQNYIAEGSTPVNLPESSARPGQTLILYGTGLGAITASDSAAPPAANMPSADVEVLLGGVPSRRVYTGRSPCCSGLDQIVFEVPQAVPAGCDVPLVVRSGSRYSNYGSVSIALVGRTCAESVYSNYDYSSCRTGRVGYGFVQVDIPAAGAAPSSSANLTAFAQFYSGYPYCPLPYVDSLPTGTCSISVHRADEAPTTPTADPTPVPSDAMQYRGLNAGPRLSLTTPQGPVVLSSSPFGVAGAYAPHGATDLPVRQYGEGRYVLSGPGGADVGAFEHKFETGSIRVTSPTALVTANSNTGLPLSWTAGPGSHIVGVLGLSYDLLARTIGTFTCYPRPGATSFTVPPWVVAQMPDSSTGVGSVSVYRISTNPDDWRFSAPGLDHGYFLNYVVSSVPVQFGSPSAARSLTQE